MLLTYNHTICLSLEEILILLGPLILLNMTVILLIHLEEPTLSSPRELFGHGRNACQISAIDLPIGVLDHQNHRLVALGHFAIEVLQTVAVEGCGIEDVPLGRLNCRRQTQVHVLHDLLGQDVRSAADEVVEVDVVGVQIGQGVVGVQFVRVPQVDVVQDLEHFV